MGANWELSGPMQLSIIDGWCAFSSFVAFFFSRRIGCGGANGALDL
jgi:hypothetical protein